MTEVQEEGTKDQIRQVINLLLQQEEIVKINKSLYFYTCVLTRLKQDVVFYQKRRKYRCPRFKFEDMIGLTRKLQIFLLEYFDKIKQAIRIVDKRILRKT